jgi:hypothetical protein
MDHVRVDLMPHIRNDIRTETNHCLPCQRVNIQRQGYHPLKSINAARPMDHVQVDLIVGIPVSTEGYTAIAVSKDIHTGYIWLHPLTTKGATEVATAIMSIIRQFGPMKVLHTDNGKKFKNRVLCKITEFTRIHHRFGSSFHPRAQGAVERENVEIERLLRKICMGAFIRAIVM